jgi:hypothetical protein
MIPSNTLIFRSKGSQVAVVTPQGTVQLKTVVIGRDLGTSMEVLSGIDSNDAIVLNPPDSIGDGDVVNVTQTAPADSKAK